LAQMHLVCRTPEVAFLGECQQVFEAAQVHRTGNVPDASACCQ
jgi:hypothetical protein